MKIRDALFEQLVAAGMPVVFGNPGTTEESFLDALTDHPEVRYVMALQESIAVAMADGYARSSRCPAVVQLHGIVGLGNAAAMLYQAKRSKTPMLVLAGEGYSNTVDFDGFLGGDLVQMARPVTKWATRAAEPTQFLRVLRRAIKIAATAPRGPVFLSLPMDLLDSEALDQATEVGWVDTRVLPTRTVVDRFAHELLDATAPMLLVGDGVAASGGREALESLAEAIGAPIFGVDFADLSASFRHPLFQGLLGHSFGSQTREVTLQADVVLAIGTPLFPELFPSSLPYFAEGAKLLQVDDDDWEISKNFPATLAVRADPAETLRGVLERLEELFTPDRRVIALQRRAEWAARAASSRASRETLFAGAPEAPGTMSPASMMRSLVRSLPRDVAVFDEALTSSDELQHYLRPDDEAAYLLGRGGCIGVGLPGAIGLALAQPTRRVVAVSGDGSALYVVQALWTAAHLHLPVAFVICNNRSYRILKVNILRYWQLAETMPRTFPHMDLTHPEVSFARIAEGFGIPAQEVKTPGEFSRAMEEALAAVGPYLVDVRVDGSVGG